MTTDPFYLWNSPVLEGIHKTKSAVGAQKSHWVLDAVKEKETPEWNDTYLFSSYHAGQSTHQTGSRTESHVK